MKIQALHEFLITGGRGGEGVLWVGLAAQFKLERPEHIGAVKVGLEAEGVIHEDTRAKAEDNGFKE